MKRTDALMHVSKAGSSISYRYEHKTEVNEALGIAIEDIIAMDKLTELYEDGLKGEDVEAAILEVIQDAMTYIK